MPLRGICGKRLLGVETFGTSGSEGMGNLQSSTGIAPSPALFEIRCSLRLHQRLFEIEVNKPLCTVVAYTEHPTHLRFRLQARK